MTTSLHEPPDPLPPRDFLIKDYELKVRYLTDHFSRMWTRFNYFVSVESALVGGKFIFGDGKLSTELAIVGAALSAIWYIMGAEDRFLVRVITCTHYEHFPWVTAIPDAMDADKNGSSAEFVGSFLLDRPHGVKGV